jgi:RNA polymerase sigma-70 factor, ECF subfamily
MNTPHGGSSRDAEARFRDIYEATYDDLMRFAQRRVESSYVEDVAAETMLVAWRRFDQLPAEPGDARAWLFGIARNLLLNAHRGARRRGALEVRIAETALTRAATEDAEVVARRVDLSRAWRRLSSQHQEALALTVWDDLTSSEAAIVLGISPVAYRLRLSRARRALRVLTDHLADPATDPTTDPTTATATERSHA